MKILANLQLAIRLSLMLIFSYSGFFKVQNFTEFKTGLLKTGIFSQAWLHTSALTIVGAEVLICILLLKWPKTGVWGCFMASIGFTAYISYLYQNNVYSECGCGGILNTLSYPNHMVFNISMIVASALYLLVNKKVALSNTAVVS